MTFFFNLCEKIVFEWIKQKLGRRAQRCDKLKKKKIKQRDNILIESNKTCYQTCYSLDQHEGVTKDFGERCTVNDGIFPFTVLYDIVGQVKKVESVWGISCERKERRNIKDSNNILKEDLSWSNVRRLFRYMNNNNNYHCYYYHKDRQITILSTIKIQPFKINSTNIRLRYKTSHCHHNICWFLCENKKELC